MIPLLCIAVAGCFTGAFAVAALIEWLERRRWFALACVSVAYAGLTLVFISTVST